VDESINALHALARFFRQFPPGSELTDLQKQKKYLLRRCFRQSDHDQFPTFRPKRVPATEFDCIFACK
jgi:hypothetical protein